ncbi:iron complex transport system substrate-binding protein [Catalinimonas alkaloidigena]|uniref:heme/hemin ABC transporter substrate-binding protein n=1 Tax=Catalinimonas alkaloidigena TaxID=1075417 RepID=UPI00240511BC|nr:ABC transporter substrate-binding protein [Catalinimonas alkaloidigena]MDF9796186.1 iron complex transport system substrate-binding protein [Catalinimonas alkaloidigena]
MRTLFLYTASCLFALAFFFGCASKSADAPQATEANKSERIITIGGTITEITCALGACDQIVATDRTSTYPPEMQSLPSLGYRNGIKAEGIIAQNPTLILAEAAYMSPDIYTQLESAGIPFHTFENKTNTASTFTMIQEIGKVLGKEEKAKVLNEELEIALQKTDSLLAQTTEEPKVLFVYARGHGTLSICGKETFAETIISLAGGTLAVPEVEGYKPLTPEALIKANPDFILFFNSGLESLGGIEGALEIQGVMQTNAGKNKNIIAMDGLLLSGFSSRLGKASYNLAQLIHPELTTASL